MRILLLLLPIAAAFSPQAFHYRTRTVLQAEISRRDALISSASFLFAIGAPLSVGAFSQQLDDYAMEPAQQATNGKVDLNSAFVGEYKQFRGMFPHAAGKIASNGPYYKVKDIYRIPDLTDHDIAMFRKYEDEFTTNEPGRAFKERINARVST